MCKANVQFNLCILEHYVAGFGGIWGMLAVGIFGAKDELEGLLSHDGILHGGGFYLFGVQLLACCCFAVWASSCTFILIWVSERVGMTSDLCETSQLENA